MTGVLLSSISCYEQDDAYDNSWQPGDYRDGPDKEQQGIDYWARCAIDVDTIGEVCCSIKYYGGNKQYARSNEAHNSPYEFSFAIAPDECDLLWC